MSMWRAKDKNTGKRHANLRKARKKGRHGFRSEDEKKETTGKTGKTKWSLSYVKPSCYVSKEARTETETVGGKGELTRLKSTAVEREDGRSLCPFSKARVIRNLL